MTGIVVLFKDCNIVVVEGGKYRKQIAYLHPPLLLGNRVFLSVSSRLRARDVLLVNILNKCILAHLSV